MSWNENEGREAWDIPGAPSSPMTGLGMQWPLGEQSLSRGARSPLSIPVLLSLSALDTKHAELTVACRIPQPEAMPGRLRCSLAALDSRLQPQGGPTQSRVKADLSTQNHT